MIDSESETAMTASDDLGLVRIALMHAVADATSAGATDAADGLAALLAGVEGWEARTEQRVQKSRDGGSTWETWTPQGFYDSLREYARTADEAAATATGGVVRFRAVESDVVVLRSVPRVLEPEAPPLVEHGPSVALAPEAVVRRLSLDNRCSHLRPRTECPVCEPGGVS